MKFKLTVILAAFLYVLQAQAQTQDEAEKKQSNDLLTSIPTPQYFLDNFVEFRRSYMNLVTVNSSVAYSGNQNCIVYAFNNNKENNPKNSLFSICISSKVNVLEGGLTEIREMLFFTTDKGLNGQLSTPAGSMVFVRRGKNISVTPKENLFQIILPRTEGSDYYSFSIPDLNISYHAEISSSETKVSFKIGDFQINWFEKQNSNESVKSLQLMVTGPAISPVVARVKAGDILFYYKGNIIAPASYLSLVNGFARSPLTTAGVQVQSGAISHWGWPNVQDLK